MEKFSIVTELVKSFSIIITEMEKFFYSSSEMGSIFITEMKKFS